MQPGKISVANRAVYRVVCCRFYLTATPFAANPSGAVRATGVMFNQRERQIQKSPGGLLTTDLFFEDLLGFNLSVFPGVFYCHAGVYQVPLLNRQFVSDPA
ncbi:hypothetical protein [Klebsiella pneumoniae]|uniref:hypothetical protein n=1 Tax=Klebsiella pneumoniae TaxID=573 RepID=UPI0022B68CE8|nr:hypothetical protein [Klebsiella pneumoniae]